MSTIPSIANSAMTALDRGFATLDRAALKLTSAGELPSGSPEDQLKLTSEQEDPLLSGILDFSTAKLQVGVGTALMRVYKQTTGSLLDMLG